MLLSNHRKAFYRSANAIFGKIGRIASEDVILQLIKSKCIPSLLYGFDACSLIKSQLSSLDFIVNRFFIKLFKTNENLYSPHNSDSSSDKINTKLYNKNTKK